MEIAGERRLEENMKTIYLLMVIALILVMLTGCAARPNDYVAKPAEGVPVASFRFFGVRNFTASAVKPSQN